MKNWTAIKLGEGIGPLQFGMAPEEVILHTGNPDEIERTNLEEDGAISEIWHFEAGNLSLTFQPEFSGEWVLVDMVCSTGDLSLKGIALLGDSLEEITEDLQQMNLGDFKMIELEMEEEETNICLLSIERSSLNLWFENDELKEIQWGVLWGEDGQPKWPDRNIE